MPVAIELPFMHDEFVHRYVHVAIIDTHMRSS